MYVDLRVIVLGVDADASVIFSDCVYCSVVAVRFRRMSAAALYLRSRVTR